MIKVSLPDGSIKEFEKGTTVLEVAKSISEGLARNVISASFNGTTVETKTTLTQDGSLVLYTWKDDQGKKAFWHSSEHVLAQAIQKLYQDYQKINEKIKISKKSISSLTFQENPKPLTINIPNDNHTNSWGPLGTPPSPPKLIRQNATDRLCVANTNNIDTVGPYSVNVDEDVPDSWEDL